MSNGKVSFPIELSGGLYIVDGRVRAVRETAASWPKSVQVMPLKEEDTEELPKEEPVMLQQAAPRPEEPSQDARVYAHSGEEHEGAGG